MQSHFNILTFFNVKRSQRSNLAALECLFLVLSSQSCVVRRSVFLRIVYNEAKTTEKFHSKKNGHARVPQV